MIAGLICLQIVTLSAANEHRKLIIIIDTINDDLLQAKKLCNNKVIIPGPQGTLLRNALHDECAPIITSKNLFQICYNFFLFAQEMVEENTYDLEKKYGKQVTKNTNDTISHLKQLVAFLYNQYKTAQHEINVLLEDSSLKKGSIVIKTLNKLGTEHLFVEDLVNLQKNLNISDDLISIAQSIITYYKIFLPNNWHMYMTQNRNYFLIPKQYPTEDFSKHRLYIKQIKEEQIIIKKDEDLLMKLHYEGKLFLNDIDQILNNMPFEERKSLDCFMVGHGLLKTNITHMNAGLLAEDFQKLITILGQGNTHSFFYMTCHGGGITAKKIWFDTPSSETNANITYQIPFITIVTPTTELAFRIDSPFWFTGWINSINNKPLLTSLITNSIDPYIAVPNIKKFFSSIGSSLPKALHDSLEKPLSIAFANNKSIQTSQLALIKFPGTDWFSPHIASEQVLEITKTKAAKATTEGKIIEQPLSKKIIFIATPVLYAPLVIHQTQDLQIVSLLSRDSSYKHAPNHITTYLKKIIIKDTTCKTIGETLTMLSLLNIAPCSIIPGQSIENGSTIEIKKEFVIDEIEDSNGNIIAKKFVITRDGTFFVTNKHELRYFGPNETKITALITDKLEQVFHTAYNSAKKRVLFDENKEENQARSQTVTHKMNAMQKIEKVLAERLLKIRGNKEPVANV